VPLNNVVVRDQLPPALSFQSATQLGQILNGQVVWNVGVLAPRDQKVLQVTARCAVLSPRIVNVAVATADPGLQEQSEPTTLEVRGVPAYALEIGKVGDPVPVGGKVTYRITVTNTGSLPGNQIEVIANVPKELQVINAGGPTQARQEPGRVVFPPVDALAPRQTLNYTVETQALQAGDVRFRVELRSSAFRDPVIKEESTNIFVPPNGAAAPP
jgi:uncharacterized repeat protein (TIGR01451 family)